jgi:hypothetical protein
MQIFFGACLFLVAVVLLAYVPGKLMLLLLKRSLSPLEDVTLACVLGLVVSGLTYWLFGFAHQAHLYVFWPLATAAVFVYLRGGRWKAWLRRPAKAAPFDESAESRPRDRSSLVLAGVFALGVMVLGLLPQYYTNLTWRADGAMSVHAVPDAFLHLAIANELTHTIPPETPLFSGHRLSYHYGMDLVAAMFARATGLNTRDLTLRFMPTLFMILSMFSVFCFSRSWLGSGYFASLVVFLVFFGEDFAFIPGLLQREKADWSVIYFNEPTVFSLFYHNSMLPAVGLLFAAFFCLQSYLRDSSKAWLFLSALLLVALLEVKVFTAAQIMSSLGVTGLVYVLLFRDARLFKVGALTAILAAPLILTVFLSNKSEGNIIVAVDPWPYVSLAMDKLGLKNLSANWACFTAIALPTYLIGCLGLRVIGVPRILKAMVFPRREFGLRFLLAFFVVSGVILAMSLRVNPAGLVAKFDNGAWFLVQSKYVAWIFAVEILQTLYCKTVARGARPTLVAAGITAFAVALSIPATVQHLALKADRHRIGRRAVTTESASYRVETVEAMDFLLRNATPGDVVLPSDDLLAPVLALTKCRVPIGYFANTLVPRRDFLQRQAAQKAFWTAWRLGKFQDELLHEANVRFVAVKERSEGIPAVLPVPLSKVFQNSEVTIFKVD